MKIRHKFGIGFITIIVVSFISLNLVTNKMKINFIVNEIKEEMSGAYKSTYRFTNSYSQYNLIDITQENLIEHIPEIATNISEDKICELYVLNDRNEQLYRYKLSNSDINYDITRINKFTSEELNNTNLLDINYENNTLTAATIFPLYMSKNYVATIVLTKDFTSYYRSINEFIKLMKITNIIIFIIIIVSLYLLSGKIVNPLITLKKSFKDVENGYYDSEVTIKSKDEIGELASGFSSMKKQIKSQIETINNEKEKVLALQESKTEFFNNVTHELKTPLTTISGYSQILQQDNFNDDEFHDYALDRIEKESERMNKMVVTLIEVSKNNTNVNINEKYQVNLKHLLNDILSDLSIKATKYRLDINKSFESVVFNCIEEDMRSLFINIIDNAIKYSIPNTCIDIISNVEGNNYIFKVINSSDEITEKGLNKIFQPFYREDIEKSRKLGSNGLGLFICSQIVDRYKGIIDFKYDEKVIVTIKLPLY